MLVDYKVKRKAFKHKLKTVYVPVYKEVGHGGDRDNTSIKRAIDEEKQKVYK